MLNTSPHSTYLPLLAWVNLFEASSTTSVFCCAHNDALRPTVLDNCGQRSVSKGNTRFRRKFLSKSSFWLDSSSTQERRALLAQSRISALDILSIGRRVKTPSLHCNGAIQDRPLGPAPLLSCSRKVSSWSSPCCPSTSNPWCALQYVSKAL